MHNNTYCSGGKTRQQSFPKKQLAVNSHQKVRNSNVTQSDSLRLRHHITNIKVSNEPTLAFKCFFALVG